MAIFIKKITLLFLFFSFCRLSAVEPDELKIEYNQAMYIAGQDRPDDAFDIYQKIVKMLGRHDLDLLRRMALQILDKGAKSANAETRFLSLLGAAVAFDETSLYLIENALKSNERDFQLLAINFLTQYHNDEADRAIESAMRSPYLIVRLAALQYLCDKQHPKAFSQAEALLCKVPEELAVVFPSLFFMLDDPRATRAIKKLLNSSIREVKIATIRATIENGREDFLPILRRLVSQHEKSVQEAALVGLGIFKDYESRDKILRYKESQDEDLALAALFSLHQLGDEDAKYRIMAFAKAENIKAISLLDTIESCDDVLFTLLNSKDLQIRVNAALILLKRGSSAALPALQEVMVRDGRDLALVKAYSPGRSFCFYKLLPNCEILSSESPIIKEQSLRIKEAILTEAQHLPEKDFLYFAESLIRAEQNDLIPHLTKLLEKSTHENAGLLFKTYSQFVGAPLIRNYCNLALLRLGNEESYKELLKNWLLEQKDIDIIRLRPLLPDEKKISYFSLTAEDTSRLALETLETFVQSSNEESIDFILQMMKRLKPNNRYVLSGLLIRATL